ncbi:MAG: helix-turn-helix domain-containing protein [Armatimonadetes bacterium]|nr:helix-turn-helix domain-containing protein [Armatimonadota bacterium]
MPQSLMETILHPVRLQILWVVSGREVTPQEIAQALPSVAQASLYRHLARLVEVGVLKVVRENRVRGAVEKVYAVVEENARISREEFMKATKEDHYRYFQAFLSSLLPSYQAYLQNEQTEKIGQTVSYSATYLYLTNEDKESLSAKFRDAVTAMDVYTPGEGKRRFMLSTILFPETAETESEKESS